ncbi:MAG TPA: DinB family protein [Dehalococcoidia bacterium]|nr:DinB family protein [Dehalococcoidia bacterium]
MSATETTLSALERNWQMVHWALEGMTEATMAGRPNDQSNSISWLLWHMTRVADRFIHTRLKGAPQLWIEDGWHGKFGMPADPHDFGMGWSLEEVAAWQPPGREVLVEYFEAANSATRDYLRPLTASGLERKIYFPAPPDTISVGDALGILVWDNIAHGGQIAYLRGYYQGMGWQRERQNPRLI